MPDPALTRCSYRFLAHDSTLPASAGEGFLWDRQRMRLWWFIGGLLAVLLVVGAGALLVAR